MARELSAHLAVPHVELDGLFHGPNWEQRATFAEDVDVATRSAGWVVDGNYVEVRDLLWSRADTVVWLDLPRSTTVRRAVTRTFRRVVTRVELWNGNRERLSTVWRASHPIRWTWQTHARHRGDYEERIADPRWGHLEVVRLRSSAQAQGWLRDACARPGHSGPKMG